MAKNKPNKLSGRKPILSGSLQKAEENRIDNGNLVSFNFSKILEEYSFTPDGFSSKHYEKFCEALQVISSQKWTDVYSASKNSVIGSEYYDIAKFRSSKLREHCYKFGKERVLILRYYEDRPMIGIRQDNVFILLGLEYEYDDIYFHTGKKGQNFK